MTLRAQLIRVATAYAEAFNLGSGTVSRLVFHDGKTLPRVIAGGDVTTGSFERAMALFSARWPADLAWPADVPRPEPLQVIREAAE